MSLVFLYRFALCSSRVVAQCSFVFAAIYAGIQWEEAKTDSRIKETLVFYDNYNSSSFIEYRNELSALLAANRDDLLAAKTFTDYGDRIKKIMKSSQAANGFDLLVDLFDGLSECVSVSLCDENVTERLFRPRANDLYNPFFPYIKFVREENYVPGFATGLERIRNLKSETPNLLNRIFNYIF